MYFEKSVIGIVPARSGSKGIPNKNMKLLGEHTLIGHAAKLLNSLSWVDNKVISTDNIEYAAEGEKYGLTCPGLRPPELASDDSKTVDVIEHVWKQIEEKNNSIIDLGVIIEPTSPLRTQEDIEECMQVQYERKPGCTFTVSETPAHFTFEKSIQLNEKFEAKFVSKNAKKFSNRHHIPKYFHRNGLCYCVTRDQIFRNKCIAEKSSIAIITRRPVVNIDTPFDLELAQWLKSKETVI